MADNVAASDDAAVVKRLRDDWQSRYGDPRTELVEAGRVRDFILAMDEPLERKDNDPVPPLFLLTLGRNRRPKPSGGGSAVNGGDEFEFFRPVYVGDRITVTRRIADIKVKQRSQGPLYILTTEVKYTNQRDEHVAVGHGTLLRWGL